MMRSSMQDFSGYRPTWCPGCGNWGIGSALKSAYSQLGFSPSSVMTVFGIGCSGNMNDFLNSYAIHSLHGRAIPNAIGMKIANHNKPVVVVAGDGDTYGEGGNHIVHACRGNHDITVVVHDNHVYGLTTGQASPTAKKGYKSSSTPQGLIERQINPLALALTAGATFVSQSFAGNLPHIVDILKKAISHRGFSLVNILQPCVTFNKVNTFQYFLKRVYKLDNSYESGDFQKALKKSFESNEEKFPLGVIYQSKVATYTGSIPQLSKSALLNKKRFVNMREIYKQFI